MKLLLLIAALADAVSPGAGVVGSPWSLPREGSCTPQGGLAGWPVGQEEAGHQVADREARSRPTAPGVSKFFHPWAGW